MGFMWDTHMWVCIGLPIGDPHRLYGGYAFGFANVCPTWASSGLPIYGFALGLTMCVQHGLNVGYPYLGLHRFAYLRPTWALFGLPLCGFTLVLPTCVRHGFYVGYPYVGLRWFCSCACPTEALCICARVIFCAYLPENFCVKIHDPRIQKCLHLTPALT